jgi:hypothetical protein
MRLYVENLPQDDETSVPVSSSDHQGFGELTVGRGRRSGQWGDPFPGEVSDLRIWAGAMNDQQILQQVLRAEL